MIPFAGDTNAMSRLPAMEKVDTARHWAELAKVGTRLGGEYRRAQADKEDLKLAGQLLNGGQPPTPEQEQTAQTGEAVFNQDQQLIDQAVQKQSSNQEISLRNNRIADMRSDPVKNEVMLKLGQSNPAMLKNVVGIMASEDAEAKIELDAQAKQAATEWGNLRVAIADNDSRMVDGLVTSISRRLRDSGNQEQALELMAMPVDHLASHAGVKLSELGQALTLTASNEVSADKQAELDFKNKKLAWDQNQAGEQGGDITSPSPKDFTVASIAEFQKTGNAGDLKRYHSEAAKRGQATIDRGMVAAEALPNVNRALELIGMVETGGVDEWQLSAKQFLGIESANEAELSNNLGKAVLSQLKTIFGTQFTEREGALLKNIEANFGKSNAGNKRILNQTKKVLNLRIDRGIKRAESMDDLAAIEEINAYRNLNLSPDASDTSAMSDEDLFK